MSSGLTSLAEICSPRYFLSQCPFQTPPTLGSTCSHGPIGWQWLMRANCHWKSFYIKHQRSALLEKVTSAFLLLPSHLVCRSIVEYTVWARKADTALVLDCPWDCSSLQDKWRKWGWLEEYTRFFLVKFPSLLIVSARDSTIRYATHTPCSIPKHIADRNIDE